MVEDARHPAVPVPSRRQFLKVAGSASVALALGLDVVLADGRLVIPNAEGFLVVDMKKCQGCSTCMMACSLAHVGRASYNLSAFRSSRTRGPTGPTTSSWPPAGSAKTRPASRCARSSRSRPTTPTPPTATSAGSTRSSASAARLSGRLSVHPRAAAVGPHGGEVAEVRPLRRHAVPRREGRAGRRPGLRAGLPRAGHCLHAGDARPGDGGVLPGQPARARLEAPGHDHEMRRELMTLYGYAGQDAPPRHVRRRATEVHTAKYRLLGRRPRPGFGAVLGFLQGQDDQGRPRPGQRLLRRRLAAEGDPRAVGDGRCEVVGVRSACTRTTGIPARASAAASGPC